ncbi:hypothetical protein BGX28_004408 [Mortierella sp. GBA30]|nr:hypothetical protein BGX28_004408 [Mortierella sp. GBA30]
MEYRRLVSEAHLIVQEFLQAQGYSNALLAFESEAGPVLEDIPKSMPTPKPLLEILSDIRMAQLHSQLGQLNMPSQTEEQDFSTPGGKTMPNRVQIIYKDLHPVNIIFARTADVAVPPAWQDLEIDPEMTIKRVPALVTAAADRTVKFTLLDSTHGDDSSGQVFRIFHPHDGVALDIDFHPLHPELMLTSAMDKTTVLTNTITGEEHQKFRDHTKFVVRAKFAMNGALLITGSHDKTVNVYKAQQGHSEGNQTSKLPMYVLDKTLTFKGAIEGMCVLPSSKNRSPTVIIGTRDDNHLHYIDLTNYNITKYNMNVNKDDWVSFTPMEISASPHNEGGYVLVSTDSPTGRQILFRTDSALQLFNYYGVPTDGYSTPRHVWDRSGKYFYVTGNDHKIYCFEVGTQVLVGTLDGHSSIVRGLFMDHGRNMLVSCGFDKTARTWVHSSLPDDTTNTLPGDNNVMILDNPQAYFTLLAGQSATMVYDTNTVTDNERWAGIYNLINRKSRILPEFEPDVRIKEFIKSCKILVIGAGGLGCEILKNLALSGFCDIHVIDMDTIDVSNLNRQFLFRRADVGKPKALTAAEFVNKRVQGVTVTPHYCKIQDKDEDFYQEFAIVICGLDSIEARRWINATLVGMRDDSPDSLKPLIDGGTEGFKGQARVILPGISSCYECSMDMLSKPTGFPLCTIANTPRLPEHCIEWASVLEWPNKHGDRKMDTDEPKDIQWLYETALARAKQYNIPGVTYSLTQGVVKNIIPAIAATNAIIAASCCNEALKLATSCANYLDNYMMYSGNDSVYTYTFQHQRKDDCPVCSSSAIKLDFSGEKSLEDFMDYLKEKPDVQLKRPSFAVGGKPLYMQAPKQLEEAMRPNLAKPLKELFSSGDEITITDSTLPFSMQIQLTLV